MESELNGDRSMTPAVSVVMPVHNAMPHLDFAVESILDQSFREFEFVILDDASTDGSRDRLRYWAAKDRRIRLLEVGTNLGPPLSSERVAREARAPIVARMDADDICATERLREQLDVLNRYPEVGVVASLCDVIDAQGRQIRSPEPWRLSRKSRFVPFAHGAMMYRQAVFEQVGGYREECEYWEDQDLVTRMAAISKIVVIPHSLYKVRQSTTSTRVVSKQDRLERAVDLMYRSIERLEQGRGYDDLLQDRSTSTGKLDPRVYVSLGSVVLWAGGTPKLFRRMLRDGKLSFDMRTASALVWTAWAGRSPGSLRAFLKMLLAARNALARSPVKGDQPVPWSPGCKTGNLPDPGIGVQAVERSQQAERSCADARRSRLPSAGPSDGLISPRLSR